MILFTSAREKGLWIGALIVVFGIFSTLGLANSIAIELREYGLDLWLFLTGCFLVTITVITQGLGYRPGKIELFYILGVFATYFMVILRMGMTTERSHLIEYGVLAVLILSAIKERNKSGKIIGRPWLIALLATTLIGTVDELLQLLIPQRVFDYYDIIFNAFAASLAIVASEGLTWIKKRFRKAG